MQTIPPPATISRIWSGPSSAAAPCCRPWQTSICAVRSSLRGCHDGQAQDTKKQETPGQKQPETEESKTTDEETPDYIVITEVVDSSEHKQDSNQVVDGVAQTLDPDLLNEILAQTSEVGEYQIYVKNDDELLISGPVPSQTANEDVNYPTLESSLDSASIYLGQKNRYKLANEEDAQSGLALVEE